MARQIFDFLEDLTSKKTPWNNIPDSDRKSYSPYMIQRWLSMDMNMIPLIADIQSLTTTLTPKEHFILFRDILPKQKLWLKYTSSKGVKDKDWTLVIGLLCKTMSISSKEAEEHIELLLETGNRSQIETFLHQVGYSSDEIKKIMK